MNRPVFLTLSILACAAAAWLGWNASRPAPEPVLESVPAVVTKLKKPEPPPVTTDYTAAASLDFDVRNGRPLADILAVIDRLRLDPLTHATVDDGVSGELFALIQSLEPDEIAGVLRHIVALPPPVPDKLLAVVLGRWARFDGAAAMKWAEALTASRQDTVRGDVLAGWAHREPAAAWAWYQAAWEAAPEPRYRLEQDFPLLIHAWGLRDPQAALEACLAEGKHGTFDPWAGFGSLAAVPERRAEVMAAIASIADEKQRQSASRSALGVWSASAPMEAAAWLDANLPAADQNLLWAVAERYGRANPRANADWLLKRTPPDKRDEAYGMCLYQWVESAPDEAAAWLETVGVTDQSAQIIAGRLARSDVDRAVAWAARVSPANRAEAVANTLAQARTAGKKPDVSQYSTAAGISAEALGKLVEKAEASARMRF